MVDKIEETVFISLLIKYCQKVWPNLTPEDRAKNAAIEFGCNVSGDFVKGFITFADELGKDVKKTVEEHKFEL